MRFVWAVAAFVLAALMIGAGIAERTVFQGPTSTSATMPATSKAPFVLIDGAVLNSREGTQTVRAQGSGKLFASYARTSDLKAWLADTSYDEITMGKNGKLSSTAVAATVTPPTDSQGGGGDGGDGGDAAAPAPATHSPVGSDLWLDEFQQDGVLIAPMKLPAGTSVLIATDGTKPAPSAISITWPLQTATPWSGPLILGGAILMAVGVLLYFLAIRHIRRSRGPRRKALPPLPVTEPIDLSEIQADKGVISATPQARRSLTSRRAFAAIPIVAVSALAFTGCSADAWPQFAASASPSPSASVIVPAGQQAPAVTEGQAGRILNRIAKTVAEADAKNDDTLAGTRLDGAMLAERVTNYTVRGKVPDYKALAAIPTSPLTVTLPQAQDGWPRTVMTVVSDPTDKKVAPTMMVMTQQDPWSEYKLTYSAGMEAQAELPAVAAAWVGAPQVQPDSKFLVMAPQDVPTAYADLLTNGDKSAFAKEFDSEADKLRVAIEKSHKEQLDAFNQTGAQTGSMSFSSTAGDQPPVALATLASGAIVAVNVFETVTVKPTQDGAQIKPTTPAVKALAGDASSTGIATTYSDQLFFYVPGQGSTDKIRLLAYNSGLHDAQAASK
ncbi:glycosyl transferase [Microbacterium candidum]|uniref:Glycosyl transferase n=1 Tax=Microbacterium candidum TaxID=3041922 RepID=A0ABT7MZS1_9MICO|nr:glycosyl transferase [Microbacterium sp. ASV49]MDL9979947.1 glycosyl transferase [Microbacterium sp. ASV49]